MPSSVGSRVLPTSCQLLTLGSRRRPILYRPGSTRGGRKGPVHLSGAILIGRNATVHKDCGKEAVDFFEAFCIAPLARHCYLTTELCIMQTSGADADTLQALPLARHPCREQPHYKPTASRTPGAVFCIPKTRTAHPKVDRCVLLRVSAYSSARMAASSSSISPVIAARLPSSIARRLFR